jgi:hypothetical protein
MEKKEMSSLWQVMQSLKKRGFSNDFSISPDGQMICSSADYKFKPDDVYIVKTYRFEGDSDPGDMSVLYAIQARNGIKGLLVDAYGAASECGPAMVNFIRRVKIRRDLFSSGYERVKKFFRKIFS